MKNILTLILVLFPIITLLSCKDKQPTAPDFTKLPVLISGIWMYDLPQDSITVMSRIGNFKSDTNWCMFYASSYFLEYKKQTDTSYAGRYNFISDSIISIIVDSSGVTNNYRYRIITLDRSEFKYIRTFVP